MLQCVMKQHQIHFLRVLLIVVIIQQLSELLFDFLVAFN